MSILKVFVFSTKGINSNEELRILTLLSAFKPIIINFNYQQKLKSSFNIIRQAIIEKPNLIVMEGTGLSGGLACMFLKIFLRIPYIFSSGDAVAPFIGINWPVLVPFFEIYERLLCRLCIGFIGWTPYLVGRSLTFGAPKAITIPGWIHFSRTKQDLKVSRTQIRHQLGIPDGAIVFGLLGALPWNNRVKYCYGMEIVKAILKCDRDDIYVLISGDGTGKKYLEELSGSKLNQKIFLTGEVPLEKVLDYLSAMDIASLPQSVDKVGSFRYTTKVCEYLGTNLPIVTNQIPMAYDLLQFCSWRLPGKSPWDKTYVNAFTGLMMNINPEEICLKMENISNIPKEFDRENQIHRVTQFINEIFNYSPYTQSEGRELLKL